MYLELNHPKYKKKGEGEICSVVAIQIKFPLFKGNFKFDKFCYRLKETNVVSS